MSIPPPISRLRMLPRGQYVQGNEDDPLRYYYWPWLGRLYRRRVELCLAECRGGDRVLEVGFGAGVSFLNLSAIYTEIHGIDLHSQIARVQAVFERHGIETQLEHGDVRQIPFPDRHFDTVLLVSILEHLQPTDQAEAFSEIARVLKPGGQVVYGVPVERPMMMFAFGLLGCDIRQHHFSTERDVARAAGAVFDEVRIHELRSAGGLLGTVYQVGHFRKRGGDDR